MNIYSMSNFIGKSETFSVTLSFGITIWPDNGNSFEELYINADKALYQSKDRGKNTYIFYSIC